VAQPGRRVDGEQDEGEPGARVRAAHERGGGDVASHPESWFHVTPLTGDAVAKPCVTGQSGDVDAVFVGGNLALDFVGTLNERGTNRVENLTVPGDLDDWLVEAGVLTSRPGATVDDLAAAVEVREALYRVIAALIDGTALPRGDLRRANEAASAAPPTPQVTTGGRRRGTGDVTAALSAVARDALALVDRDDDAVLKWCADEACTHPFLDRSRGHRRRWCEMAACGDGCATSSRSWPRAACGSACSRRRSTSR